MGPPHTLNTTNGAIHNDEHQVPTPASSAIFHAKVLVLQFRRGIENLSAHVIRHPLERKREKFEHVLADSRTPLWTDDRPTEQWYQLGKVENLRRAVRQLDGCVVAAGSTFSFWKQIGRASRSRGYVEGRMLQQGCVMPAVGGGLCQLSNVLYDLALRSHCEVVERHPHSRPVQGALVGRDATIAWNYVDLRFRPKVDLRIDAHLNASELVIAFEAKAAASGPSLPLILLPGSKHHDETCSSCGEIGCAHHEVAPTDRPTRCAWILDAHTPEFDAYVGRTRTFEDALAVPLDGNRWQRPRYAWTVTGFRRVYTAALSTLLRAWRSRRLSAQGAVRQTAMLETSERLSRKLERVLSRDVTHVTVSQTLLPFLWKSGVLGGRTFDVLADRLPMFALQQVLDDAFKLHPESQTLSDFRAPTNVVRAEQVALQQAQHIITPHASIAALYPTKTNLLAWCRPTIATPAKNERKPRTIAFPGPTVARKGAYELRDALDGTGVNVWLLGSELEGNDFWQGFSVHRGADWMQQVALVVQPSFVEGQPRALLRALVAGIPVIATEACGIPPQPLLTLVPAGDAKALRIAIAKVFELQTGSAAAFGKLRT
jgi:hypothetical protein